MSYSKVGKILSVGIPMMTFVAADDPQITDLLFKDSKEKDRKKSNNKKDAETHIFSIFGDKGKEMTKAIAEETGTTEEEVNGVMSLFLPAFVDGIADEEPEDAGALGAMFKKESDDAKKHSPSLAKMAMKSIF